MLFSLGPAHISINHPSLHVIGHMSHVTCHVVKGEQFLKIPAPYLLQLGRCSVLNKCSQSMTESVSE